MVSQYGSTEDSRSWVHQMSALEGEAGVRVEMKGPWWSSIIVLRGMIEKGLGIEWQ